MCGLTHTATTARPENRVELFLPGKTKVYKSVAGREVVDKDFEYFYSPIFVNSNGMMVALAEAEYTENGTKSVDTVARYITTEGNNWMARENEGNGSGWAFQFSTRRKEEEEYLYAIKRPLAVAKDKKIYLLVLNKKKRKSEPVSRTNTIWGFELIVGEVKGGARGNQTVQWQTPESTVSNLMEQFKTCLLRASPYGGSAFLMGDGKVVFVVRALSGVQDVSSILYLNDTGNVTDIRWLRVATAENCFFSSFFPWEGRLMMIPTHCSGESHEVRESSDMGRTWTNATGAFSCLWDTLQDKRDFTTATIENKSVLLYTEQRVVGTKIMPMYETHLWITDGNRAHDVGLIVTDANAIPSSSLLYTDGELFYLHQQWNVRPKNVFLTQLKDELRSIKLLLKTWTEKDAYLSRSCNMTPVPTDGLVGFLSDKGSNTQWQDEYLCMNATVWGETKVPNGYTFRGAGAGAWWPVGYQSVGKRYNFVRHGLTVVMTVTIHEVPAGEKSPLLTIVEGPDAQSLGLWYGKNGRWNVMLNNVGTLAGSWVANKTYSVALTLRESSVSVCVDGEPVGSLFYAPAPGGELLDVEHLFIGGYGDNANTESHLTVTNVLLYSRPLNDTELKRLGRTLASPADG